MCVCLPVHMLLVNIMFMFDRYAFFTLTDKFLACVCAMKCVLSVQK